MYVGIALFAKGFVFLSDLSRVRSVMADASFPHPALAEPIAVTHLAGGLLLTFGLWTRVAAAAQVPILVGAVLFIHLREGLFAEAQTLELALLVLVLLCLFMLGGAGPLSVDAYFPSADPLNDAASTLELEDQLRYVFWRREVDQFQAEPSSYARLIPGRRRRTRSSA
jgi:uncharacterized membrane protein YphA (DoxX/SURF4 family)